MGFSTINFINHPAIGIPPAIWKPPSIEPCLPAQQPGGCLDSPQPGCLSNALEVIGWRDLKRAQQQRDPVALSDVLRGNPNAEVYTCAAPDKHLTGSEKISSCEMNMS